MRYSSSTNSLRGVSPAWSRAAPSVTKRWIVALVRAEGTSAANRVLWGDTVTSTLLVIQINASNNLQMQNGSAANNNAAAAIGSLVRVEGFYTNLLTTDYDKVGATTVSGQNAGNNGSGSAKRFGGSSSGSRWQGAMAEHAEYEGIPTLSQLSKSDAYFSMAYGAAV